MARIIASGEYTLGGDHVVQRWTIPIPSQQGRIRFAAEVERNVSGEYSDVVYGTRSPRAIFTGATAARNANYAIGTWVTSFDNPMSLDTFAPNGAWLWDNLAETGQQWRSMMVGPELLSGFAQNNVQEFDLRELGGGGRFVGIWISSFWVGGDPSAGQDWAKVKYTVEDESGLSASQPLTFAFPVTKVADGAGAALAELDPSKIVAQANLQRFGGIPLSYTTQASFRCQIANGGQVALDAQVVPYVGTIWDQGVVRADVAVSASSASAPSYASVEESEMQGPYSYVNIYLQNDGAEGFEGGPAIVWVCVG